jgi:hypothetical protein
MRRAAKRLREDHPRGDGGASGEGGRAGGDAKKTKEHKGSGFKDAQLASLVSTLKARGR